MAVMASRLPLAAVTLVIALRGVTAVRQDDFAKSSLHDDSDGAVDEEGGPFSWGNKMSGSYCCYNVDPVSKARFTAVSVGKAKTDNILKCDIVANHACPVEGDKLGNNEDGTEARFVDQAATYDKKKEELPSGEQQDHMEHVKAALYTHASKHMGEFLAEQNKQAIEAFRTQIEPRFKLAEKEYKEETEQSQDKYMKVSSEFTNLNQDQVTSQIDAARQEMQGTVADAERTAIEAINTVEASANTVIKQAEDNLAAETQEAEAAAAKAIKEAEDNLASANQRAQAQAAQIIKETQANHAAEVVSAQNKAKEIIDTANGAFNDQESQITETASGKLADFVNEAAANLTEAGNAAFAKRQNTIKEVSDEGKATMAATMDPIKELVDKTQESWNVAPDVQALYEERKAGCEGGDAGKCCCLGTMGDSRDYQAFKVPANYALGTCAKTAPYHGGFMGLKSCGWFQNCNPCIEKLCNKEMHCGSAE